MNAIRDLIALVERAIDPRQNEAFMRWFGKSVVVDTTGAPLIVYRGEHGESDTDFHTRLGSLSFGSQETANLYATSPNDHRDGLAKAPRVMAAYLSIQNPVISTDDPFIEYDEVARAIGAAKANEMFAELTDQVEYTNNWEEHFHGDFQNVADLLDRAPDRMSELYMSAYPVFDSEKYVGWFRAAGYDGAIHGGYGDNSGEDEYKIFDPSQAKPIAALGG